MDNQNGQMNQPPAAPQQPQQPQYPQQPQPQQSQYPQQPQPQQSQYPQQPAMPPKKKHTGLIIVAAVLILFVIVGIAISHGGSNSSVSTAPVNSSGTSSQTGTKASSQATAQTKSFSTTLVSGFYEIGTDIPAGTYNLAIASGSGNVIDADDSINLLMGSDTSMYQKDYKNAELKDGNTLQIRQCSIKITSNDASTQLKKRDNSSAKAVKFSSGKYTCGKDFQPGYYDLKLVSGSGSVTCRDNELDGMMGEDASVAADVYVKEYKNVHFEKDFKLDLEGPTIQMTPSK